MFFAVWVASFKEYKRAQGGYLVDWKIEIISFVKKKCISLYGLENFFARKKAQQSG